MTTQAKSMDQGHAILIVVLVGALLWMFMKSHKGGVCSLFGGKESFSIGGRHHDPVTCKGHGRRKVCHLLKSGYMPSRREPDGRRAYCSDLDAGYDVDPDCEYTVGCEVDEMGGGYGSQCVEKRAPASPVFSEPESDEDDVWTDDEFEEWAGKARGY